MSVALRRREVISVRSRAGSRADKAFGSNVEAMPVAVEVDPNTRAASRPLCQAAARANVLLETTKMSRLLVGRGHACNG